MPTFGSGSYRYEVVDNWAKKPKGWPYTDVAGVAVDSLDRVYLYTRSQHPVMVFDKNGTFLRSWGEGLFVRPHAIFVDSKDNVWCTDDLDSTVRKFDTNGNLLMTLGAPGVFTDTGYDGKNFTSVKRAAPPFNRPTKAIATPSGEIFVADGYGNARIHKFSATGELLKSWGEPGTGHGQFVLPHAVLVDKSGMVYVADRQNNRMQVFSGNGEFVRLWQGLQTPMDMLLDPKGNMIVAEGSHRVSVWSTDGKMIMQWGEAEGRTNDAGLFYVPHAIALDSRGVLYVAEVCDTNGMDRGYRAVQKFVLA